MYTRIYLDKNTKDDFKYVECLLEGESTKNKSLSFLCLLSEIYKIKF